MQRGVCIMSVETESVEGRCLYNVCGDRECREVFV